ncbi:MAG: enolase [Microgenomates group bacterium Gr01-1014_5]|nr:MAG: enolase [Microgenomates group bacterium Gr01-1014_5]
MAKISRIWAREILDSRAYPTIEAVVQLDTGQVAVSSIPSGASVGKFEALELRDGDEKRFAGKGVLKAVDNVNQVLGPAIVGMDPVKQAEIDKKLIETDGSKNKSRLGANAVLAVSQTVNKAGALASNMSLYQWVFKLATTAGAAKENLGTKIPTPIFNMINGGLHGAGNLDFQEFFVVPATSKPYSEALRGATEIYYLIRESLIKRGAIHSVGDEGGYAPNLFTNADALAINLEAIGNAQYQIGSDFFLGLDVAANIIFKDGAYTIRDRSNSLSSTNLIDYFEEITKEYKLTLLEDPLQEEDWEGWKLLTEKYGQQILIVGDDLLVTNPERVKKAIEQKSCNAILVKPNQIGTITETLEVIRMSREAGWKVIVSHRSGETNDWYIADFAVGVKADFVKFGAPARGERTAKYNRLLTVEAELAQTKSV